MPTPAGDRSATSPSEVLSLVRLGRATSRADVARETGLSATTAAARVEMLIRRGWLVETGTGPSAGGRPPRRLEMRGEAGRVVAVSLGERHAAIAVLDAAGRQVAERHLPIVIADGPEVVLRTVVTTVEEAVAGLDDGVADAPPLLALCVGVPGPVSARTGLVVSPARMPGWNGADVAALVRQWLPVPVIVQNDANLMALGEHAAGGSATEQMVFVKVGSGIGCGVVAGGALHRGSGGFAGDISHTTVPGAPPVPCSCGRVGCLDAVASGAALVEQLAERGVPSSGTEGMLDLARDAHPLTTQLLREAGSSTGTVLSTILNFFNPERLVIGGHLSSAEAFVAGVRSAIYAQCPPMITDGLEVAVSRVGQQAAVLGAAREALDLAFSPEQLAARAAAR
ncbi:ROK family transcriptional regulator [Modestobacter marinus]|nr:ROK family protein [Modestobacter marinus]NIH68290.1 putative NBD/HSP70 family sugar kinase [Modestobacter marinus]